VQEIIDCSYTRDSSDISDSCDSSISCDISNSMAYKYQYNPAATDNVSLGHLDNGTGIKNGTARHRRQTIDGHRKHDDDRMSGGTRCCFGMLMLVAQVLLHGVMALTLYWIIQYHSKTYDDGSLRPFAWREDPDLEWNMHPVLMVAGFIYFMGEAMLMYRTCRCCRRIWTKLLHSIFHILAIPCIAMGFLAAWDYHSLKTPNPIPHFYSLHSWLGLATMGLFVLQFVVGFFSFLLLLCCESATASFRAALVPVHSTFGTTTFLLAIATCVAGLTEKAYFTLSIGYTDWFHYAVTQNNTGLRGRPNPNQPGGFDPYTEADFEEAVFLNVIGGSLVLLAVVIPCIVQFPKFRVRRSVTVIQDLRYQ